MSDKNKISWNKGAAAYSAKFHTEKIISGIIDKPQTAFISAAWDMIQAFMPDLRRKRVCVPSSGDNHAVLAFAALGASVTSCDISENQLDNAKRVAKQYGLGKSIEFVCADTMKLENIKNDEYDFVFTSNGVHVWINDLNSMYRNIHRVMKPGGVYIMCDIHPFERPFGDDAKIIKPYDMTGPFEYDDEVTFHWRVMDIMNAIISSSLSVNRINESFADKNYDDPFWISLEDQLKGVTATREEVDRMHDWHNNPMSALPSWLSLAAV